MVMLYAFGHGCMDYEADIGAVDSHAEGDGGHHDINLFSGKLILMEAAVSSSRPA